MRSQQLPYGEALEPPGRFVPRRRRHRFFLDDFRVRFHSRSSSAIRCSSTGGGEKQQLLPELPTSQKRLVLRLLAHFTGCTIYKWRVKRPRNPLISIDSRNFFLVRGYLLREPTFLRGIEYLCSSLDP